MTLNRQSWTCIFSVLTRVTAVAIFGNIASGLCGPGYASHWNEGHGDPQTALKSVLPGPLEDSRKILLTEIEDADKKGVGIQSYIASFKDLEVMVKNGEPREKIESRLKQIREALKSQLSDRESLWTKADLFSRSVADSNSKVMPLQQGRVYILALVNKERARYHLAPLAMDPVATAAAQMHSDEMARMGYVSHWDSRGRKPDQRYTELGGTHNVGENIASCSLLNRNINPNELHIVRDQQFSAVQLSNLEADFVTEKAPDDLHRLQTFSPEHNKLGVGLSYSENGNGQWCMVLDQEFIDQYGDYSKLPRRIVPGKPFQVSGSLYSGVTLNSISICWEAEPRSMTKEELMMSPHEYGVPETSVADYLPGDNGPLKIWKQNGRQHFSVGVVPHHSWKPGLYYIVIYAAKNDHVILVSNRTTQL